MFGNINYYFRLWFTTNQFKLNSLLNPNTYFLLLKLISVIVYNIIDYLY